MSVPRSACSKNTEEILPLSCCSIEVLATHFDHCFGLSQPTPPRSFRDMFLTRRCYQLLVLSFSRLDLQRTFQNLDAYENGHPVMKSYYEIEVPSNLHIHCPY